MTNMKARWDAAADGWRQWWPRIEQYSQPVSDRLVAMADLRPGQRVLDVASGTGEPALTAARTVGPDGAVVATDLSPAMLAVAADRALGAGLTNVEIRETDAETLDVRGPFDAVLCRWGLMFVPDVGRALRRMRELLVPGGRLAVAVWRRHAQFEIVGQAAERVLPEPLPYGDLGPLRFADPAQLLVELREAGFEGAETDDVALGDEFESPEAYVEFVLGISSVLRSAVAGHPEREADLRTAIADEARKHLTDGGRVRIRGVSICIGARSPREG